MYLRVDFIFSRIVEKYVYNERPKTIVYEGVLLYNVYRLFRAPVVRVTCPLSSKMLHSNSGRLPLQPNLCCRVVYFFISFGCCLNRKKGNGRNEVTRFIIK